jgi:Domain of unknown function (DUF1877)
MSTAHAILIALSSKRLTLLESEPEMLEDVVEARHDEPIPGLLDLKTHWETLDLLLSGRGREEILGDALLARTGKRFDAGDAFEQAKVLSPGRVAEIAAKLADVPKDLVAERFKQLAEAKTPGKAASTKAVAEMDALFGKIVELYAEAAKAKQSMLALLV